MAEKLPQQVIYPYSGSQNSTVHPVLLDAKDIIYSDNVIYTLSNTKKIRPGLVRLLKNQKPSGSNPILGAADLHFWSSADNGLKQYFVYVQGSNVIAYNLETDTYAVIKSGIATNTPIVFEKFYGLLVMCVGDKNTIPQKWNGVDAYMSDLFSDGSTYKSTICRKFLNKLWIDDPSVPGRAIGSKTNDPTDFTTGDSIAVDFNIGDGDPMGLTAFMPPKDRLMYIGKKHSLFSLTPTYVGTDLVFVPNEISTDADIGCISHNGCVSAGGYTFFPSERGYHRLTTSDVIIGIDTKFASAKIQNDWIRSVSLINPQFISATYSPEYNSIFVLYPRDEDIYSNNMFGYSLTSEDWYSWENFNQSFVSRFEDPVTKRRKTVFYSRDGDIGYLSKDHVSDYGKFYTMKLRSGTVAPGGIPNIAYDFKFMNLVFTPSSSGKMRFAMQVDGKHISANKEFSIAPSESYSALGEDFILGLSNLGGIPSVYIHPLELKGSGVFYCFLIVFTPESDSEKLEIVGLLLDSIPSNKSYSQIGG